MSSSGKIKVLGLSDPLTQPTGFGRVARELFSRLSRDKYDLGFLSRGWVGSRRYPGLQTYSASQGDELCAGAFPMAASDFEMPFVLWTLMDPWQTGWLSHPEKNAFSSTRTAAFLQQYREQMLWVGHYPVDGLGLRDGLPFWYEDFFAGPDCLVFMSEFGREASASVMKLDERWHETIVHAVNTDIFQPVNRQQAREVLWRAQVHRAGLVGDGTVDEERLFRLDRPIVIAVMANRRRKYWPTLLEAFALVLEQVPDAGLIGLCGDRAGAGDDAWPLEEICAHLGLRTDGRARDPNVWLISTLGGAAEMEDKKLAVLYNAANVSALISAGEGSGLPQVESHACGMPCVVGRYSASRESIVDPAEAVDPSGWTYEGNNCVRRPIYRKSEVARHLIDFLRDDAEAARAGAKGIVHARQRSWEVMMPRWDGVFERAWGQLQAK